MVVEPVSGKPMEGNLAWAPLPAFEEVEVLDRFNGVPTLGSFGPPGNKILFWRITGYVPQAGLSIWLYVPLSADDESRLASADPSELLNGLIFQSPAPRAATVALADDYRLVLEADWILPAGASSEAIMRELLRRLLDELGSKRRALAPWHRKTVRRASKAIEELAAV